MMKRPIIALMAIVVLWSPAAWSQNQVDLISVRHGACFQNEFNEVESVTLNFMCGDIGELAVPTTAHNFAVFDLTGIEPGSITSASFRVFSAHGSYQSQDPTETYTLFDFEGDPGDLIALQASLAIHEDLGDGSMLGEAVIDQTSNGRFTTIPLTPAAVASLNDHAGELWALGGRLTTLDADPSNNEVLFTLNIDSAAASFQVRLQVQVECSADANGDGVVDLEDISLVLFHYGASVPAGTLGDLDESGTVDLADLSMVLFEFGIVCS